MVMSRILATVGVLAAALSLTACEASKSSNPLSASVAGPIPGVDISAPKMLEPGPGSKISIEKQPVTLLIENAGSTGPRPLTYSFDIATDAAFNNKVFARDSIPQGEGGRTSLQAVAATAECMRRTRTSSVTAIVMFSRFHAMPLMKAA